MENMVTPNGDLQRRASFPRGRRELVFGRVSPDLPLGSSGGTARLKADVCAAALLLQLAKVIDDRAQIIVEALRVLLSDLSNLFNDRVFPHRIIPR
jgi:hypothetical protein